MNRDPANFECTRDPIFLLQTGFRQWTQIPDGLQHDGDSLFVVDDNLEDVESWVLPFLKPSGTVDQTPNFWEAAESEEGDHGWPYVYIEWKTESVFLTRAEGEAYGKKHAYRWQMWKVYCIPCDGELSTILNEYTPKALQPPTPN